MHRWNATAGGESTHNTDDAYSKDTYSSYGAQLEPQVVSNGTVRACAQTGERRQLQPDRCSMWAVTGECQQAVMGWLACTTSTAAVLGVLWRTVTAISEVTVLQAALHRRPGAQVA
jgi:hypothetical protein